MFDDATLRILEKDYPLGFFVCNLDRFDENYNAFLGAFRSVYAQTKIAYSYKTNYLPALCLRNNEFGGYAEVVSRMEYDYALRLGIAGQNIIFNGPVKTREDYLTAARLGSIVNVDSDYEIDLLDEISREHGDLELRIGIRCAVTLPGMTPSRFGLDVDDEAFLHRVNRLRRISSVRLEGLHCHMIPHGRTAASYAAIVRRLLELAREIWGLEGPRFIDMGGGYFSNMVSDLRAQFDVEIPSFTDYGEAIARPVAEFAGIGTGPELILEPGLAIVADTFQFVCRVLDIKSIKTQRYALVAGSVYNIRPTKSPRNLPMRRIPSEFDGIGKEQSSLDVVGYTCMEDDVLHRGYGGPLSVGDLLVFSNVGAYSLVLKPPFIQGNVPVVAYRRGLNGRLILKRAETLDDIMATYSLELPHSKGIEPMSEDRPIIGGS